MQIEDERGRSHQSDVQREEVQRSADDLSQQLRVERARVAGLEEKIRTTSSELLSEKDARWVGSCAKSFLRMSYIACKICVSFWNMQVGC